MVQVHKQKYPATEHSEAMSWGEEVMGGERYNIFRFNSGKQGKTMPDYNPYTIKRCNGCDVTRGKLKLISDVLDNELCSACQCIHNCQNESNYYLDEKYRERLKISIQADNTEVEE